MFGFKLISLTCLVALTVAQQDYQEYGQNARQAPLRISTGSVDTKPTPIPILKQINRHNEDGSYTYGYEGADGSFKIETKLATGEVKGKYGYTDETGKVRIVEYGANKYGFQPSGEGITVAPPTLVDETTNKDGINPDYDEEYQNIPVQRPQKARVAKPRPIFQEAPQQQQYQPQYQPQPQQHQPQQHQPHQQQSRAQFFDYDQAQPQQQRPQQRAQDVVYAPNPRPSRPEQASFDVRPQQFPNAAPAPAPVRFSQPSPSFAPAPIQKQQQHSFAPAPAPRPAYQSPQPSQGRTTSVLDQLAKDYALPSGGSPALHDISFGYY